MADQRPVLGKGCYTCERRRIKCDRGYPSCQKCSRKGVICPGYGPRIKWVGGTTTRDRLKHSRSVETSSRKLNFDTGWVNQHSLTKTTLHRLVEYWDKHIAPLMVWIDSSDNLYRTNITPLACTNPIVGLAMAALSSQHALGFREDIAFSEKARNDAIGMICTYIKETTEHVNSGQELSHKLDDESAECVLAAMLILSCFEMANTGAAAAEFHRQAARSLVNTFQATGRSGSPLFKFLRNQLSIHDVFACTTSFCLSTTEGVILPDIEDQSILFSTYLRYLHDITLLSQQLSPISARWDRMGLTFVHIAAKFEIARGETLMTAGRYDLRPKSRCRDFICVVGIHHSAALLFAIRCLQLDVHGQQRRQVLDSLFEHIAAMTSIGEWVHTLAWASFIAGVEVYDDIDRQGIIANLFDSICKTMRFRNFHDSFFFLKEFWAGTVQDWRILAKQWEGAGHPVLLP